MASLLKNLFPNRAFRSTTLNCILPQTTRLSPVLLTLRSQSTSSAAATPGAAPTLDVTLRQALKGYMKSRQSFESGVIRSILADLQTTSHLASPPNPQKVLLKSIKTRLEAASQFTTSTPPRQDLADQYTREAELLQKFVQNTDEGLSGMGEEDLEGVIKGALEEIKVEKGGEEVGVKDLGRVIKVVLAKTKGNMGGKGVSEAVKKFFDAQVTK
ncbi:BZ3500_MvSof-1268-A1-R1_Chr2-1g04583 [Microbotryum saponariae]|uniref:Altered inheritance of mitochondria protein 41 n=1 Tax=Microbotryum saponariae TaxID=289078 RepID=A0A2X0KDD2_9BASI|nr:BZ3500_MvSof-1268-A1-R1_Chr2-1g04583 [Microbotryum saponariae]SCZ92089.1 BZ3501_MvSof-1269-A2-R1_Chr2-1g04239 [Microbotryum saponariae]